MDQVIRTTVVGREVKLGVYTDSHSVLYEQVDRNSSTLHVTSPMSFYPYSVRAVSQNGTLKLPDHVHGMHLLGV